MPADMIHHSKVKDAIAANTITATTNGITIDTQGFESLMFVIDVGAFVDFTATNKWTFTVEEGDVADASDMAAIAAADYLASYRDGTSGWDRICDAAADDVLAYAIGVRMNAKRYKRLVLTEAGTVSAIVAAMAILDHARHMPV